jgi:myo-inositol 2-dehydrogenase / D-chiro-inositol 1-dehydrogenase
MKTPLNVAVVGAGRIGQVHAQNLAGSIPDARLAGIAEVDEKVGQETAARLGCRWTPDAMDLVRDPGVQAIVIASPNDTHAALIIAAAREGKAILCEKPIERDLTRTDEALAAVRQTGVPLQMAFQRRYDPAHIRTHDLAHEGKLGRLVFAHSHTRDPEPPPAVIPAGAGGIFRDTCVHDFDSLRWIVGAEIDRLSARSNVGPEATFTGTGETDVAIIMVYFTNGVLGHIDAVRGVQYGYDVRTEITGTEATAIGGFHRETPLDVFSARGVTHDHVFWFPERFAEAYNNELTAFVRNVLDGRPVTPTGDDGRQALVVAMAAEQSARNGGDGVDVPAPGQTPAW